MNCLTDHRRLVWLAVLITALLTACNAPAVQTQPPVVLPPVLPTPTLLAVASNVPTVTGVQPPDLATPTLLAAATSTPTVATLALVAELLPTPTGTPAPRPACATPGRIAFGSYASTVAGYEQPYRVYLPPCYGEDGRRYPTLFLLHGNIRADDEWDTIGIDETAETLIQSGAIPPLLIVMPDGRPFTDTTSGGPWSYEAMIVDELLPHVVSTYCGTQDGTQRAIGGLSRGGYWAAEIAFRHTDLFAAVGLHAPAFLDVMEDPAINPLYTGVNNDLSGLRIAFDYGANDHLLWTGQQLHEAMLAAGVPHSWTVYDSGIHDDPYWSDHAVEYLLWYAVGWPAQRAAYTLCAD